MSTITARKRSGKLGKNTKMNAKTKRRNKTVGSPKDPEVVQNIEEEVTDEGEASKHPESHKEVLQGLKETDPEFYEFLLENDHNLLNFSEDEADDGEQQLEEEEEEDGKMVEKSSREVEISDDDDQTEDPSSDEEGEDDELISEGEILTVKMVHRWNKRLKSTHSLSALKQLFSALHCGVVTTLVSPEENNASQQNLPYQVKGSNVFNAVVVACLRYVRPTLDHHLPIPGQTFSSNKSCPVPSSLNNWGHMKTIIKPYLVDILQLLQGVSQVSMVCALLRHIEGIWRFFCCFPKLSRFLCRELIRIWSESREEPSVLAYLILRRVVTNFNEYKLEDMMKRMYLSYVRNSRFTSPSTTQHIHFMCGTLVEFLSFSPSLAYQLIFLYTRSLANHLRSAYKGKKVSLATWPFIHSLELFTSVLSTLSTSEVFSPLIYPVTQVSLGMVQFLNSARYTPVRLHIVKMLLDVSEERGTFIPLAPILLEILETQSLTVSRKAATGKLPNLTCTLKLSKIQIGSRASQTAILNDTLELLMRLLSHYSCHISFPEIAFPIISRVRRVMKKTPLTWLRNHLKQIVEKSDDVSRAITNDRSSLAFSPKDEDKIKAWEASRKQQPNSLRKFYETWKAIQAQTEEIVEEEETRNEEPVEKEDKKRKERKRKSGRSDQSQPSKRQNLPVFELSELDGDEEEDLLEELQFSSDEGP